MTYADATAILTDCRHDPQPCEVNIPKRGKTRVCSECWNRHVDARRSVRKAELKVWKDQERTRTLEQLRRVGISVGDKVIAYPSALGAMIAGARPIHGRIVERAGYVRIDCGHKVSTTTGSARYLPWQAGWCKA